ncbi:hypothetical protein J7T55_001653 [Diaporthe amygdali]|uniref:uncharacterized protein n=1 Tax=Phomopsis amygdali TaxID=1214568 RepID=UPI0022FF00BA|nr:uncharacterized protein J7T55_001653 [Diaporthe amygdali]KAJ0115243.1 hypothetical protein J7T55_001653 [Diaporthe amygdali]
MSILIRANDALGINPPSGVDSALSVHGSDFLWAVTAIFIVSFLGLLVFCFTTPESDRVFHYLFTCALLAGSVSYYAQASDLGWSAVEQVDGSGTRQIFWPRYVNWAVAFPSVTLALGLLSDVSWTTIFTNIFICLLWVVTYLVGAYTTTVYKWGFFAFGTFAFVILAMSTLNESREAAQRSGITRDYMILAAIANLCWILYPVAWGLTDGGNKIGVTAGFIFFGVLDILLVPGLSFVLVFLSRKWGYAQLNLDLSESRSGWHANSDRKEPVLEAHRGSSV